MERQMEYEEELEKKIYYRTEDGAEFVLSVLRDIRLKTGYEILQEELEYCGDRFAYNDASNTSFCYGEQYGEDKAFYCAGVARNGIWLYMEMLCPKSYEKSYKEYIEFWKNSVKDLGNIPGWQEKWERYGEGTYRLNRYESDYKEYCLDIRSIEDGEIVFSITETTMINFEKTIETTGYIRAWIVNDTVTFYKNSGSHLFQGSLRRSSDEEKIVLQMRGEEFLLEKQN